ncbi:MAG: EF-hand domain-containing protein [Rhodospirillales bacterium]
MKTRTKIIAAVAVVGLGATLAVAGTSYANQADGCPFGSQGGGYHAHYQGGPQMGKGGFGRHNGGRFGRMTFLESYDADGDGDVTAKELEDGRAADLKTFDADKNGSLTIQEFEGLFAKHIRTNMVRAFQRLDRDGDGQVSKGEQDRALSFMVNRMDRDGDGVLERFEDRWPGMGQGMGQGMGPQSPQMAPK